MRHLRRPLYQVLCQLDRKSLNIGVLKPVGQPRGAADHALCFSVWLSAQLWLGLK